MTPTEFAMLKGPEQQPPQKGAVTMTESAVFGGQIANNSDRYSLPKKPMCTKLGWEQANRGKIG